MQHAFPSCFPKKTSSDFPVPNSKQKNKQNSSQQLFAEELVLQEE